MNLDSIRTRIHNISDYQPSNPVYKRELDQLINDAHQQIWNAHKWTFATKQRVLDVHTDIDADWLASELGQSVFLNVYVGSTRVLIEGQDADIAEFASLIYGAGYYQGQPDAITNRWVGQPIIILGVEYTICFIQKEAGTTYNGIAIYLDRAVQTVNPAPTIVEPDPGWEAERFVYTTTDFVIRHKYTYLPTDVQQAYGWQWEESGRPTPLRAINFYEATRYIKDPDLTGIPTTVIHEPDVVIPGGEKISVSWVAATGNNPDNSNFPGNEWYEFAWAYMGPGGVIGPVSESAITSPEAVSSNYYYASITALGQDGQTLRTRLTNDVETRQSRPVADRHIPWRKIILVNTNLDKTTGKRNGEPVWVPLNLHATSAPSFKTSANTWQMSTGFPPALLEPTQFVQDKNWIGTGSGNYRAQINNRVRRVSLYPRPNIATVTREKLIGNTTATKRDYANGPRETVGLLTFTYKYSPNLMAFDQDAPEIPLEFEYLVAYKALIDVYLKNSNLPLSQLYERRCRDEMKALARRYASTEDPIRVRGPSDFPWIYPGFVTHTSRCYMLSKTSPTLAVKGMDERAFSSPENATLIQNFYFNDRLACWDSQVGWEPVEPWYAGKDYFVGHDTRVISAAAFYTNSSRIEYLLQERIARDSDVDSLSIVYTYPDGEEIILDTDRTMPGIDDPGTQYLTYGRFCVVTNGRDRTFKFWGGRKTSSFGFVEAPAALEIVGVSPELVAPDSTGALDDRPNNKTGWDGSGIPLFPSIYTEKYEMSVRDDNTYQYQLPSGYTLDGDDGSGVVPTAYSYYGLGTTEQLDRNTYSYCVTFISDTGSESPPSPVTTVSWVIPEKHLGGTGEANEGNPNPYGIKYGVMITSIPTGGDNVVARRIYRTKNKRDGFTGAGDVFYQVATIKDNITKQYIDFIPDNELVFQLPGIAETSLIAPSYKYIAAYDNRIWLAGGNGVDNQVIFSGAGKPEQFGGFDFFDVGVRAGGGITALAPLNDVLLVFRESAIDVITKTDLAYNITTLHPTVGTKATNTIQAVPGLGIMFLADDGVYMIAGSSGGLDVQKMSQPVGQTLQRLTTSAIARATAVYSHAHQEYWCHFPADGETVPNLGVVFHTSVQGWSVRGAVEAAHAPYWKINRLFADRDGDIIFAPESWSATVDGELVGYNVGLQVMSRADTYGINLVDGTAVADLTTYDSTDAVAAVGEFVSGWLNYDKKGQTFSVVLRAYQSQAAPSTFYTLVDRRRKYVEDSDTSAPLMNADEYNSQDADAVWDGTGITVPVVAEAGSTEVGNHRLVYVRFDVACKARESFAWAWSGAERLLLQNYQITYEPHSRQTLRGV